MITKKYYFNFAENLQNKFIDLFTNAIKYTKV